MVNILFPILNRKNLSFKHNMRIFGFSEGYHDAGVCIIDNHEIIYASHSERYSGVKNDKTLHDKQISKIDNCDTIAFYENYYLYFQIQLLNYHLNIQSFPKIILSFFQKIK